MVFLNLLKYFVSPLHLSIWYHASLTQIFVIHSHHFLFLFKVGDFYEAIGVDACILVEYAGLNPFGGLRSDSIPRAGCPVVVCGFPCVILALITANKAVFALLLFYIIVSTSHFMLFNC